MVCFFLKCAQFSQATTQFFVTCSTYNWTNVQQNRTFFDNILNQLCASSGQCRNRVESSIYAYSCNWKYKTEVLNYPKQWVIGIDDSLVISLFHVGLMSSPWSWSKLGCLQLRRASFTLLLNLHWWQLVLPSQLFLRSCSILGVVLRNQAVERNVGHVFRAFPCCTLAGKAI